MDLVDLVARQDGVVARRQALACGVSTRTIARRRGAGGWRELHPGVYLVAGHRLTADGRVRAAALWGGDDAVVSGIAAAYWLGMWERPPERIELTLPRRTDRPSRSGVRVRGRDLAPIDVGRHRGVAVTSAPLTVLQTAAAVPGGATFLDRALQRWVSFDALHQAHCRTLGSWGSRRSGELLVAAADRADSAAERRLLGLLRQAGVDGWVRALPFEEWAVDVAFPAERVAVEIDGWAWHVDVERFRNDRRKGNALVAAGWRLLRFTWDDLDRRPDMVVRRIRHAVAAAEAA
ncbi:DUF559 domain-containing protein [Pseudonocardia phyllosphaerae]|uniref:DUF559 domain-containing protein n=1 Tax=Pseudonocardia phyllosphaerae TaxID=3390502 RepID=UPI00397DB1E4